MNETINLLDRLDLIVHHPLIVGIVQVVIFFIISGFIILYVWKKFFMVKNGDNKKVNIISHKIAGFDVALDNVKQGLTSVNVKIDNLSRDHTAKLASLATKVDACDKKLDTVTGCVENLKITTSKNVTRRKASAK